MVELESDDKELEEFREVETDMESFDQETFARMVESSLSGLKEGEVVTGRVVEVSPVGVIVDIGYKAEGEIPADEFTDLPKGIDSVKPGDEFEVMIESRFMDGDEETVILSRRRAGEVNAWERIEEAYRSDGTVKGQILNRVKGGLRVDVGVPAFLPGSQVDLRPVRDLDEIIGRTFDFRVLKYSRRRRNVVLSRRVILEEKRAKERQKLLSTIEEGQVVQGVVKNVVKYGAFIDLGGMDGLLHVSDMSWGRIQHPGDLVRVGDEVKVKVLKFDREKNRISLGLKQLAPDPWTEAEKKYPVNSLIKGKVVNVVDYGAFVEIEPGLEGLIHVSEISWSNSVRQAGSVLEEGQEVEAVVLNLDPEARKLALSLKRTAPDPWEEVAEKYPVGTVIETAVKSVTDFGLFVGLDQGLDGLVHRRDISWSREEQENESAFPPGEMIKAIVLSVDPEKKRVALGMKQLTPNPWEGLEGSFSVGAVKNGKVTDITDQGVYVELAEGVEGLIQVEDDEQSEVRDLDSGADVQVRVLEFSSELHLLSLALIPSSSAGG